MMEACKLERIIVYGDGGGLGYDITEYPQMEI
jgi:hypothetical protein